MGDYGAAVSQKGYDVKTCADRFLAYSSAFQTLKVYSRYSVSTNVPSIGGADNVITINHNLGYYAPFIVLYNDSSNDKAYLMSDSSGYPFNEIVENTINSLTINVYEEFDGKAGGTTIYFTVYLFLDDFRSVSENNINTSTSSGSSSNDYGMRISKSGYDVKTCTSDQLVFSSSFFNAIIQKKGSVVSSGLENISHNLSYVPNCLVYCVKIGESFLRMCEGMPYRLNPFTGGRTGFFYRVYNNGVDMGENYASVPDYDWRVGNTFYYIIFKDKNY